MNAAAGPAGHPRAGRGLLGRLSQSQVIYLGLVVGISYLVLRTVGRAVGGHVGGRICHAPGTECHWLGPALLTQVGVVLGMALVAVEQFPTASDWLLPTVVGTTVIFEMIGPIMTRQALVRTGQTG